MHTRPSVAVLLSTYNGERYVAQLLNSVLQQTDVAIHLYIRDDGSADSTPSILKDFHSSYPNCSLALGHNIGVNASFIALLEGAAKHDYYAFCDQDDVWLPEKLRRATTMLDDYSSTSPMLYGSPARVVDSNLLALPEKRTARMAQPSMANALLENIIPGCTMVLNEPARKSLLGRFPETIRMYDWWVYQVISATGIVIRDTSSHILYRQHGSNTVGSASGISQWVRRFQNYVSRDKTDFIYSQSEALLDRYRNEMSPQALAIVERFLESRARLTSRVWYSIFGPWHRSRPIDSLLFRILYAIDRL